MTKYMYKGKEISKRKSDLIVIGFFGKVLLFAGALYFIACGMAALG